MLQLLSPFFIYQTMGFMVIAFGITEVNHQKIFGHPMRFIVIHEIVFCVEPVCGIKGLLLMEIVIDLHPSILVIWHFHFGTGNLT